MKKPGLGVLLFLVPMAAYLWWAQGDTGVNLAGFLPPVSQPKGSSSPYLGALPYPPAPVGSIPPPAARLNGTRAMSSSPTTSRY